MEHYFRSGLAPSAQRTYNSAKKRDLQFCKDNSLSPPPVPEQQLCQFVSIQSLCHNTIKSYLAAIRHLHIAEGYGDPHIHTMTRLKQVLKVIKMVQSKGPKRMERLPITPNLLAKLKEVWSSGLSTFDGQILFAAASLCFFGFMRSGELTIPSVTSYDEGAHLSFNDATVDCIHNPHILRVYLKASKTDPFRVGVNIYVGRTGTPFAQQRLYCITWWQEGRVVVLFSDLRTAPLSFV